MVPKAKLQDFSMEGEYQKEINNFCHPAAWDIVAGWCRKLCLKIPIWQIDIKKGLAASVSKEAHVLKMTIDEKFEFYQYLIWS